MTPVAVNDVLVEIETAKSLVELPSPFAGVVGDLLAAEGDTVDVGAAIITIAGADASAPPATAGQSEHGEPHEPRGRRRWRGPRRLRQRAVTCSRAGASRPSARRCEASVGVVAKPPIRKLARDLGVDLADVAPSGPAGEVTREDVMKHASQASVFRNIETPEWGDVREETIPVAGAGRRGIRPRRRARPPLPEPVDEVARSRSPCAACARRRPSR